jgi:hypothetical protein
MMPQVVPQNPQKLRELAAWYRDYAERAAAPWVIDGRLQTAADLERYAALLEAGAQRRPAAVTVHVEVTDVPETGKLLQSSVTDRRAS